MRQIDQSAWMAAFDCLVHRDARGDVLKLQRHRAFLASRLVATGIGLAAFPVLVAYWGVVSFGDAMLLLCLAAPLASAIVLSRTGKLEIAQTISSCALLAVIGLMAWHSGGLNSFLIGWLIVTLVEAALAGSPRLLTLALGGAAILANALIFATLFDILAVPQPLYFAPLLFAVAAICLAGNAFALSLRLDDMRARFDQSQRMTSDTYRLLANHAPDMISLHSRNGNVLFATPAAKHVLGLSPLAMTAATLFERVHVQDRPAFLKLFEQASVEGKPATLEFRLRDSADGKIWNWVEMRCAPFSSSEQGTPLQLVAVTRTIQERKSKEDELLRLGAEADRANAVKSRFLAHVSHELRTPLNAIIGFSEMMTDKNMSLSFDKYKEYAGLINDSGKHLLDVVNAILDLSKIEAGTFAVSAEPFQPVELVEKCLALMQPTAAKAKLRLKKLHSGAMPEIFADRRACMQIFLNLLSNAIKFTPPGGEIHLGLQSDAETVTFIVNDTGIGIDEDDLPRLAQPFVQAQSGTSRQHEGAGLGLSLVKNLAELQGGKMRISSKRGKGTIVSVTLPRCAPQRRYQSVAAEAPALKAAG